MADDRESAPTERLSAVGKQFSPDPCSLQFSHLKDNQEKQKAKMQLLSDKQPKIQRKIYTSAGKG